MNTLSHIAIIMDGNGRWALKRKKSRNFGHKAGLNNIKYLIETCIEKKIKFLTLYVFSLDNWKRPSQEISYLFNLLDNYLNKDINYLLKKKIKLRILGETSNLKKKLIKNLRNIEKKTNNNFDITVNLAFNYSSKREIEYSVNNYKNKNKNKYITINDISNNLYTANIPDPEILIRTGGTNRLSDFLLWQLAYTEIFFIKKLWPDFNKSDLNLIIKKFFKIKRNFGNINE